MLIFLFLPLNKCSSFSKYFHYVREYKNFQTELKSGNNYYGKLQVDETSDEIKSNQKLTVFM